MNFSTASFHADHESTLLGPVAFMLEVSRRLGSLGPSDGTLARARWSCGRRSVKGRCMTQQTPYPDFHVDEHAKTKLCCNTQRTTPCSALRTGHDAVHYPGGQRHGARLAALANASLYYFLNCSAEAPHLAILSNADFATDCLSLPGGVASP